MKKRRIIMVKRDFRSKRGKQFWAVGTVSTLLFTLFAGYGFAGGAVPSSHASVALAAATASRVETHTHVRMGGTVTIVNVTGGLWTCQFSPFSPAVNSLSIGVIYEPLVYINPLTNKQTPWLASAYKWSNGNRTLTFTIRKGVRWSDGKPFSAADVVFTFNLMKRYSALDLQAVWTVLTSVRQQGSDKVVMTFKRPVVPYFYYIADQNGIVPKHIWSKIKNPVTYGDRNPVGTGPFLLQQCTPQTIVYVRNPRYWQKGLPYIDKVVYPAFTSNPPGNAYLATGRGDWGGQFIPNIKTYYIARDPVHNHYWFPPTSNVDIYINQTVYPLSLRVVRQAIAYAIDRQRVSTIGEYGYEPASNQTGIVLPTFRNWYNAALANSYGYGFKPQKAIALLQKVGFKRKGGIFYTKSGKPLSFSIINVGGFTDWVASVEVIKSELAQIGIKLTPENLSSTDYDSRLYNGRFELAYDAATGGPTPYYEFRNVLYSANTAPIGKPAASNYERWRSKATDRLLDAFAATTNSEQQHRIMSQLEGIMLKDVPVIPVTEAVSWYQWSTAKFTGWPTPSNPYANPAPYDYPDWEVVLIHLHLK
jgi:peptide/nickel transport system substrate-binding protein